MLKTFRLIFIFLVLAISVRVVLAAGVNFNDTSNKAITLTNPRFSSPNFSGNTGIGTTTPQTLLAVVGGNVGIGTWTADGGNLIIRNGNVGIGSISPGQSLDVNGTIRIIGNNAYSIAQANIPTVICTTGPVAETVAAKSTDFSGQFTIGATAQTSCSVSFRHTWHTAPFCIVEFTNNVGQQLLPTSTTTTLAIQMVSTSSKTIDYICGPDSY
jgi:hypothetical protein